MTNEELEELRQIKDSLKALEEAMVPAPPPPPPKGLINEFKAFIADYKVMGLAVAFILGLALKDLVSSLVANLIMPIITLIIPTIDWSAIAFGPFMVGLFIGALIDFIIIAFIIFLLVKLTSRLGIE